MSDDMKHKIESLQGPILVLGASGFIGANILRSILKYRDDVIGVASGYPRWRLNGIKNTITADMNEKQEVINSVQAKTVFDFMAYGSYPFQKNSSKIRLTNIWNKVYMIPELSRNNAKIYIHAGSSSEYGTNSNAPLESGPFSPNGDYADSKLIWSLIIRDSESPVHQANLRLYSVYGPYEDGSRLIPQVIQYGLRGEYPPFVRPDISRDFVYVDDVVEAFVDAALNLKLEDYGGSFNIGTGIKTTIADMAEESRWMFGIGQVPTFSMPSRDWDHANDWYANPTKARERLGWQYRTSLTEGIAKTVEWYQSQGEGWEWPTIKPPTA